MHAASYAHPLLLRSTVVVANRRGSQQTLSTSTAHCNDLSAMYYEDAYSGKRVL